MNDKKLKDMWNKAESFMDMIDYESTSIEQFISNRSSSAADKISKMIRLDLVIKLVISLILIIDIFIYYNIQPNVSIFCFLSLILIIPLIIYELKTIKQFSEITDNSQSTNKKITKMLTFLKSKSIAILMSTSSTYFFGFSAGILLYFFAEYGELRRMGSLDIFVFPTICFLGIIFNYIQNSNNIKFQIKHFKLCLSDLDEDIIPIVSQKIEKQQKDERKMNLLIGIIVLLSLLVFIAVLKSLGI